MPQSMLRKPGRKEECYRCQKREIEKARVFTAPSVQIYVFFRFVLRAIFNSRSVWVSATMADVPTSPGSSIHESSDRSPRFSIREQDRFLPITNISRIMKKGVPTNGKIAKDAEETVQECVPEFISFITSETSDKC
ncbi:hypothetical protein MRB53_012874 [Persea americana]|uniref:Uncharacterized protein n=1 Tax=Persea americana TaxID=3435 RepID=A0ACC2LYP9_PERAE|nr:hypothetical protein MRB53_012874 [Persea americana]